MHINFLLLFDFKARITVLTIPELSNILDDRLFHAQVPLQMQLNTHGTNGGERHILIERNVPLPFKESVVSRFVSVQMNQMLCQLSHCLEVIGIQVA